jgi:enoyl-CoA hydratase
MSTKVGIKKKSQIAYIELNRPERLNAIDLEMLNEFNKVLQDVKKDDSIKVIIISGNGEKGFSAGADISYLRSLTPTEFNEFNDYACEVFTFLEEMGKVSIAAMHGYTVGGGCELSEACTLRVAEEDAQIGQPEINIAGVAGWGGTTRLPRLIGSSKALELLLTGRIISAQDAANLGLVNRVAPKGKLIEIAEELAQEILSKSSLAIRYTIDAVYHGIEMNKLDSLKVGAKNSALMSSTQDFIERTNTFLKAK